VSEYIITFQQSSKMHTTCIRKAGKSITMAIPLDMLKILGLRPGAKVGLEVRSGRLIVVPWPRVRYTLDELVVQCKPKSPTDQAREAMAQ
jgi:antitoxin component of MazEF toxin-antitoxin module